MVPREGRIGVVPNDRHQKARHPSAREGARALPTALGICGAASGGAVEELRVGGGHIRGREHAELKARVLACIILATLTRHVAHEPRIPALAAGTLPDQPADREIDGHAGLPKQP